MAIISDTIVNNPNLLLPIEKKYIEASGSITDDGGFVIAFNIADMDKNSLNSLVFSSPEQVAEFGSFLSEMAKDLKCRVKAFKDVDETPAYFLQQIFNPEDPAYDSTEYGAESEHLQKNPIEDIMRTAPEKCLPVKDKIMKVQLLGEGDDMAIAVSLSDTARSAGNCFVVSECYQINFIHESAYNAVKELKVRNDVLKSVGIDDKCFTIVEKIDLDDRKEIDSRRMAQNIVDISTLSQDYNRRKGHKYITVTAASTINDDIVVAFQIKEESGTINAPLVFESETHLMNFFDACDSIYGDLHLYFSRIKKKGETAFVKVEKIDFWPLFDGENHFEFHIK